jgi:hypothetical protein
MKALSKKTDRRKGHALAGKGNPSALLTTL